MTTTLTPKLYKPRPHLIEAVQWDGSVMMADVIEEWTGGLTACMINLNVFPALKGEDFLSRSLTFEADTENVACGVHITIVS